MFLCKRHIGYGGAPSQGLSGMLPGVIANLTNLRQVYVCVNMLFYYKKGLTSSSGLANDNEF